MGNKNSSQKEQRDLSAPVSSSATDGGAQPPQPNIGEQQRIAAHPQQQQHSAAFGDRQQVTIIVHPEFRITHVDSSSTAKLRFVFELVTEAAAGCTRPPMELCLVLDNSGSMAGTKLQNLKQAVESVLELLQDDDIIHIVSYNSEPSVLIAKSSKRDAGKIRQAVHKLVATGGTNISEALRIASQQISVEVQGPQKRMFLYTDGQPFSGLMTQEELSDCCRELFEERHIHVSTFGIGTDVNGPLLEAMAESGSGAYHFMTERRMQELSKKAVEDVSRVIATRGELEVVLHPEGAWTSFPEYCNEKNFTITLGDIREGNTRRIAYCMDVPASAVPALLIPGGDDGDGNKLSVGRLVFSCQPIDNPLHMHLQEMDITCTFRTSPSSSVVARNPVVAVTFALNEMSDRNERAVRMINEGSQESLRGAIRLLEEGIENLRAVQSLDDESFVETAVRRVERTLARLQARGLRDAPRVALELQMQRNTFDRNSAAGYAHSDDGNHSVTERPSYGVLGTAPVLYVDSPHRRFSSPPGGSPVNSEDWDASTDLFRRGMSPPHPFDGNPAMSPFFDHRRSVSPVRMPTNGTALRPIDVPQALIDAVAVKERDGEAAGPHIPPEFFCSITHNIMDDPVMTSDGHTYQRAAIEKWIAEGNISSPLTGLGLCDLELRPNLALRSMIANWRAP